jgi:NitT/TauT family transport system permease protein
MRRRDVLLGSLALLVLWQLLSWLLRTETLPGPWATAQAFIGAIPRGLARHFLVSGYRVIAGIALAMLAAVPLGLILGQSPALNRFFSPIVYITYPIPKIVFLPVILLLFGIGDTSKIDIF